MTDRPGDQFSRWSSESTNPDQFLILKLNKPAIVEKIIFGKFEKTHVCNVKKFKVFGGLQPDQVCNELLDAGLNNDNVPETFSLRHSLLGKDFACSYIKVVPIQSSGPSFNYSIWYVELQGRDEEELVRKGINWLNQCREKEAIRLCLKHFRQKNYTEAFESLEKRTKVQLEDQLLTHLHQLLVIDGDFRAVEKLLQTAANDRIFNDYLRRQEYKPVWAAMNPKSGKPGMRGGHQMSIDPVGEMIYLFGGWDGVKDLSDFWSYSIRSNEWTCLDPDTFASGGPSARSCHKMTIDLQRKKIFVLGRYTSFRNRDNVKSDFFVYDIETNHWQMITDDTHAMGGPRLIFEHQMVFDMRDNTLYVFGGRVFLPTDSGETSDSEQIIMSGLYAYHVPTNSWKCLRPDANANNNMESQDMKPRTGHSILFHEKSRQLYIFAGQRQKEHLRDFLAYDVDTDQVRVIFDGDDKVVPDGVGGCTQRATIDSDLNEIHVFSGSNKERRESLQNSFWVYDMIHKRWSCVHTIGKSCDSLTAASAVVSDGRRDGPPPRYAHQLVYDHIRKVHFLFGGNPGHNHSVRGRKGDANEESGSAVRLDDFWSLELVRPTSDQLLRKCKQIVRELEYRELVAKNELLAVSYLRTDLSETFDHNNENERRKFQSLAALIFSGPDCLKDDSQIQCEAEDACHTLRTKVYDRLIEFFPPDMTQPKGNLLDLIQC